MELPGSFEGYLPGRFSQEELLPAKIGEKVSYASGCVAGPIGSRDELCHNAGFRFPLNGEYIPGGAGAPCKQTAAPLGCGFGSSSVSQRPCYGPGPLQDGGRCTVIRTGYRGDPGACCLLKTSPGKYPFTGNAYGGEFNWNDLTKDTYTCNPGLDCSSIAPEVAEICMMQDEKTRSEWNNYDDKTGQGYCSNYVQNSSQGDYGPGATTLTSALGNFFKTGGTFEDTKTSKYVSNLLSYCGAGPVAGSCETILDGVCNKYTRTDIVDAYSRYINAPNKTSEQALSDRNIYTACGCHLPRSDYADWSKVGVDESNFSCDPLCLAPGTIKQYLGKDPATCKQNLCIIDNVTIDFVNSQFDGDINFNMACGCKNTGSESCQCVFSGIDINSINSRILGKLNFNQNCSSCAVPGKSGLLD